MNEINLSLPDDFNNVVRMFPLPNLVLFPGVIQALHLFEPRYRQLMTDALESDSLISMALMQPNWKSQLDIQPELFSTVCVGKIFTHARLDDGRFNLLLMGICRATVTREINQGKHYRMAEVIVQKDITRCSPSECRQLRDEVIDRFRGLLSARPHLNEESLDQLLESELPLGQLLDLIAYSSGAEPVQQQVILDEFDVRRRAKLVLELLDRQKQVALLSAGTKRELLSDFPPGFSLN